jgi:hypothetical protein
MYVIVFLTVYFLIKHEEKSRPMGLSPAWSRIGNFINGELFGRPSDLL